MNMVGQLGFVKLHLNKPQDFWNNVPHLVMMHITMFGGKKPQHITAQTTHTSCQLVVEG